MSAFKIRLLVAVAVSVFFIATVVAAIQFMSFDLAGGCGNEVLNRETSPDGKHVVFTFERDYGATTGFSTQVSVLLARNDLTNDDGGNVFVCDTDHGEAPPGPGGGPDVKVEWMDERHLKISYHQRARVFLKRDVIEGTSITYVTFP